MTFNGRSYPLQPTPSRPVFYVVPSSGQTSFNHLLWFVFQSSYYTQITSYKFMLDLCVQLPLQILTVFRALRSLFKFKLKSLSPLPGFQPMTHRSQYITLLQYTFARNGTTGWYPHCRFPLYGCLSGNGPRASSKFRRITRPRFATRKKLGIRL